MRILHLAWEYPPVMYGGLGRHVHALANAQAADGHDVVVTTQAPNASAPARVPSSSDGPVLIGTFVDEANDIAYVAIEGSAVSDGSTMTLTLGMHDSPNKIVGDPIDLTATVTCSL